MRRRPIPRKSQRGPPIRIDSAVPQKAPPAIHPSCVPVSPNWTLQSLMIPPRMANARAVTIKATQDPLNKRPAAIVVLKNNLLSTRPRFITGRTGPQLNPLRFGGLCKLRRYVTGRGTPSRLKHNLWGRAAKTPLQTLTTWMLTADHNFEPILDR